MKAFWRKNTQLTHNEEVILEKCLEAHKQATFRENASSQIIKAAYKCNDQDFLKAVMSGLGATGGMHAPIEQTYEYLEYWSQDRWNHEPYAYLDLIDGIRVPGWGSSFVKGKPDKIVENAMLYLDTGWPDMGKRIEKVTDFLHSKGKRVYPNMACLTAATAIVIGLPKPLASVLLLRGRAEAWAEICYDSPRQPSP